MAKMILNPIIPKPVGNGVISTKGTETEMKPNQTSVTTKNELFNMKKNRDSIRDDSKTTYNASNKGFKITDATDKLKSNGTSDKTVKSVTYPRPANVKAGVTVQLKNKMSDRMNGLIK